MTKKYFKTLLILIATSLLANNLFAQHWYTNFNIGYGFKMGSISFSDFYNSTITGTTETDKQVNMSFGKGVNIGGTFGYMYNYNLGAELGISYLAGDNTSSRQQSTPVNGTANSTSTDDLSLSSNMVRFIPSLVVYSDLGKINPYAKFGLVLGLGSVTEQENYYDSSNVTTINTKLNKGMAFGISAAIGVIYALDYKMSLFGELNMINLSYSPNKGTITAVTYDGYDELSTLTTKEKDTNYVNSLTTDSSHSTPDSQPTQALKQKLPFGSFGINIGFRYSF